MGGRASIKNWCGLDSYAFKLLLENNGIEWLGGDP